MSDSRNHDPADSEDEEDFNPAPADNSDEELQPADEDDEDEEIPTQGRSNRPADDEDDDAGNTRRRNDDDDDDDDEEEDEDEDEEEEVQGHRRKRRRARNAFIDEEAEVDDEDEDEEAEQEAEENEGFIEHDDGADFGEGARPNDERRHRQLDRSREVATHEDLEAEAQGYVRKYGHRKSQKAVGEAGVVPQRLLVPSVDDPSIWGVRCKEGKEREVIMSITKRIEEKRNTKDQLGITCAFERGGPNSVMKGLIYVEAYRQTDILHALDGMLNVYPRTKLLLVGIKEMPDLLRVQKTPTLEPGAWVRLKKPAKHAGDLAQVLDVTENGLEARVRFIPRIDFGQKDDAMSGLSAEDKKRKRAMMGMGPRPPQKLLNESETRKRYPRFCQQGAGSTLIFNGEEFEKGFQVKDVKIQQLTVKDVNPTLEEVTKFASGGEDGAENIDLKSLAATLKDTSVNVTYLPGDIVEVYQGEQKGVVGKATNVLGDIVTISVTEGDLVGQTIEVPMKGLRKRFRTGDHVKVIGGSRYRDEVGMVVKISEDRVTLLTDQTTTEITVFSKDLREASDIGGQGTLGQYSLLDLVQLDPTTVGCIVKVDRESLVVLDQNGDNRQIVPSQIANKLPRRKLAVAADRNGSEIRPDDVVKESGGMSRQGKIIHIHRTTLFCHSHATNENAGIFVTKVSNVATISAKGGRVNAAGGQDLTSMNPAKKLNPSADKDAMPPPKATFGRDRLVGQTVTIKKGGYKGLLGRVKETTDSHARVELHTKSKVINIAKSDLVVKDSVSGREIKSFDRRPGGPNRTPDNRVPDWSGGNRTPMGGNSARTPAWKTPSAGGAGGRTPAWASRGGDGGRTPAWADGSRTVNPYDGSRTAYGGGNRTPAWQSGSRTPAPDAWGSGSKTPAYGGGGGSSDAWGSGSKTPYGAVAPTPGDTGGDSWGYTPGASGSNPYDAPTPGAALLGAPTPGAMNAPTPGAYNAPTPAAISAPTPGASWQGGWGADSAPTPAAVAPTPGASGFAYSAPTPGAYTAETPGGPQYTDDD